MYKSFIFYVVLIFSSSKKAFIRIGYLLMISFSLRSVTNRRQIKEGLFHEMEEVFLIKRGRRH